MTQQRPSFINQASIYFLSNVVRRGISFFLLPVYTRCLSPSDYGVIEVVELLATVLMFVVGVPIFVNSITRVYFDYSDPTSRANVVSTGLILTIILSTLLIVIGISCAGLASNLLFRTPRYAAFMGWTFGSMLLSNVAEVGLAFQQLQRRARFVAIYSSIHVMLVGGLNIYFLAFAHKGIWGFILSKFIATGIGSVYLFIVIVRETGLSLNSECFKRMVRFGGPFVFISFGLFIIHFSDRFVLNAFGATAEVGIYSLAYKFGFLISYLVGYPFKSVWEVNAYEDANSDRWKASAARMAQYFFLCLAGFALLLSIFAKPIIHIIAGTPYIAAAALIPVLVFSYVFREIGDFFSTMLFMNKRINVYAATVIASAALNLALNWALIRVWGGTGAAWATLLTWSVYMTACWILAQREHQLPIENRGLAKFAACCLVCVFAAYMVEDFSVVPDLTLRIVLVGLACAVLWKGQCLSLAQRVEIRDQVELSLQLVRGSFATWR